MSALTTPNFWPTARHFAEAVQCPVVCFAEPSLRAMLPAVDRLGMPLVTSGQFAYVFKLNAANDGEGSLAVRCFRGFLGDREARYRALDAHLNAHRVNALPRFKYLPQGILVGGRRFPVLAMEWVEGPTLDVYLEEVVGRREVLSHLAGEWLRLVASLREAGVAHGDLQHGNIIVERGQLRLVDLDGMYVPSLAGYQASEVGHQHYQHPARQARHFSAGVDHFSALVVYLSLIALAERPSLWAEHHDENLLFTKTDFIAPEASALFSKIRELGAEHARLADALAAAAARETDPSATPDLLDLVGARGKLPGWMTAPAAAIIVSGRTREVVRAKVFTKENEREWRVPVRERPTPTTPTSGSVQTLFNAAPAPAASAPPLDPPDLWGNTLAAREHRLRLVNPPLDPADLWGNTLRYAKEPFSSSGLNWWGWILLINVIGRVASFGVTGILIMFVITLLVAASFLVYGYLQASRDAQAASGTSKLPGSSSSTITAASAAHALKSLPAGPPPLFASRQPATAKAKAAVNPVVGNRSLSIYHQSGCVWVDKIAPQHQSNFDSPASAQSAGYRPCRVCTP